MRRWLDRLLLLLDLPMGGVAALTVLTDAGYHYPGYAIYVSAIYTFYMAALAAVNFVRFRRLGSPALSAAKAVNLASDPAYDRTLEELRRECDRQIERYVSLRRH